MSDDQIQLVARQATSNKYELDAARRIADEALQQARRNARQIDDLRARFLLMNAATTTGLEAMVDRVAAIESRFADLTKDAADARAGIAHLRGLGEGRELTGRHATAATELVEDRKTLRSVLDSHGKTVQIVLTLLGLLAIVINYLLDRIAP